MGASHEIRIVCNGAVVTGWTGYHVEVSMITPASPFELRRPFDAQAWNLLRRDSDVKIEIDGTPILRGFVGKRHHRSKEGTMAISGRSRAGRLVDEAAPSINYTGLTIAQAYARLSAPWFGTPTLSDARNRLLRRGKGKRVAAGAEPVVTINVRVPRRGIVHPGETRAHIMTEIARRSGLIWWESCDGNEIFVGKPNQSQESQYLLVHAAPGSATRGTVKDMEIIEDDEDRYSLIMCGGVGGATPDDYGKNVTDRRGVVYDNPFNKIDGTGRDFIHPKRMFMPEKDFDSYGDAQRVAKNEQAHRDFRRHIVVVDAPYHGQILEDGGNFTLFAPNTIARVINEEHAPPLDDTYLVVSCAYSSNRDQGEVTSLTMVPTGTEILM
jgi:prophage tail gpP-like protein